MRRFVRRGNLTARSIQTHIQQGIARMNDQMKSQVTRKGIPALMIATLLLAGCGGEFAYKRGAGVNDLNSAKSACQSKGLQGNAFAQCMEESGWVFHNPLDAAEDDDPVIKASFKKDYRNTASSTASAHAEEASETASPGETKQETAAKPAAKKPADPMDIFVVNSWWKTGRGADSLKSDIQQCVAQLGPEHKPDMSGKTAKATRGLLLCMRELGWKALQAHE